MSEFRKFVDRLIEVYGTADAIAVMIGLTPSAFSRGVNKAGTLSVDKLLLLAEGVGESPSRVLRLAGKGETAALIERLYGVPARPMSPDDEILYALDPASKHQLVKLVKGLTGKKR